MRLQVLHVMTKGKDNKWTCPECGREIVLVPKYKVLVKGDESAAHQGMSGVTITGLEVKTNDKE